MPHFLPASRRWHDVLVADVVACSKDGIAKGPEHPHVATRGQLRDRQGDLFPKPRRQRSVGDSLPLPDVPATKRKNPGSCDSAPIRPSGVLCVANDDEPGLWIHVLGRRVPSCLRAIAPPLLHVKQLPVAFETEADSGFSHLANSSERPFGSHRVYWPSLRRQGN